MNALAFVLFASLSASEPAPPADDPPPPAPGSEIETVDTRWRSYTYEGHPEYTFRLLDDPYGQNITKADFPVFGDWFMEVNAVATVAYKSRENLDFSNVFADQISAGRLNFFGHNNFANQNLFFGGEVRKHDDAFVPSTFRLRINGVADHRSDINAFNADSRSQVRLFDAFADAVLYDFGDPRDGKGNFDLLTVRAGLQGFRSDFHGLVFNDVGLGARFFGEFMKNRLRYDLVVLDLFQKDVVSGFNDLNADSDHQVLIARVAWDDVVPGWNSEWSMHVNRDRRDTGPARDVDTIYLGGGFNGHLGRITFNPALYGVFGNADHAEGAVVDSHDVRAWLVLADTQLRFDYWNFRAGYLYASGDGNAADDSDEAFDAINDGVVLFGGPFSYWTGENIRFGLGNVKRGNSVLPSLRGFNEPANYINPGLHLLNLGVDAALSPRLDATVNVSYLQFVETGTYENRLVIDDRPAAIEGSVFLRFKPFFQRLNQNVLFDLGVAALAPRAGLEGAFQSDETVFSTFVALRLVY